jgi:flagellar biosynthesis/type III secretory pathway protein FliH
LAIIPASFSAYLTGRSIAEGELKGKQEGKLEGKLEGKQEGEMLALQRLLAKRFGAIPAEITRFIANAPLETIEKWFDLAIDAKQLSDIFTDD